MLKAVLGIVTTALVLVACNEPNTLNSDGERDGFWTLLLDEDMEVTEDTAMSVYWAQVSFDDGKPEGVAKVYYRKNNEVKWTGELETITPFAPVDGNHVFYYSNGSRMAVGSFLNGQEHGKFIAWNRAGYKETEAVYVNGQLHGAVKGFYETGELKFEGSFVNGLTHGTAVEYYKNGDKKLETTYVNGMREGVEYGWYEFGGEQEHEILFKNDKPFGTAKYFNRNGTIWAEIPYENGRIHGLVLNKGLYGKTFSKEVWSNGTQLVEISLKDQYPWSRF